MYLDWVFVIFQDINVVVLNPATIMVRQLFNTAWHRYGVGMKSA